MTNDTTHTRSVTTPLDDITADAARAASLDPATATVVDAGVTDGGELELLIEGEEL
jgi:hypothetical protein